MTPHDAAAFTRLLAHLDLAYPRAPISAEAKAAVYFPVLRHLTLEQVAVGVERCLRRDSAFPPSAGELLAAALGSVEERAILAFARVRRAAQVGLGGYTPLDFGDRVLHAAVVAMGGWGVLHALGFRDAETVDWATARKEFLQLYVTYAERGAPTSTLETLPAADGSSGRDPRSVALEPADITRGLPTQPQKAIEAAVTDFIPSTSDFAALLTDLMKRATVAETRRERPPATVTRRAPVSAEEQAGHEQRKGKAITRFREASCSPEPEATLGPVEGAA